MSLTDKATIPEERQVMHTDDELLLSAVQKNIELIRRLKLRIAELEAEKAELEKQEPLAEFCGHKNFGFGEVSVLKQGVLKPGDKLYTNPRPPAVPDVAARRIIDSLGDWLCRDMEKSIAKNDITKGFHPRAPMATQSAQTLDLIRDMAKRIKFYRDNVLPAVPKEVK